MLLSVKVLKLIIIWNVSQDEANGKHLGTWTPGFPALKVKENSAIIFDKVQCTLLFLEKGLEKILEDQRNDLNPEDETLHRALKDSISRAGLLAACLRVVREGKCPSEPEPPEMPQKSFEKKQWSHTLLKAATHYLHWLQERLLLHSLKKSWIKVKLNAIGTKHQALIEGSVYFL